MQETVLLFGKRKARQEKLNALPAGNLIYLKDDLSSRRFLIDSGASVSVFPHHGPPPRHPNLRLQTADGSQVPCSGERMIPLRFGSFSYEWVFQLAPVTVPILGADFLRHFHLLVDMAGQRVLDASSLCPIGINSASPSESGTLRATLLTTPEPIRQLLAEYPDVLSSDGFSASPWDFPPYQNHPWSSSFRQSSPFGSCEVSSCQSRIRQNGGSWNYPPFRFPMGKPLAHGSEERWILETLWRL